MRRVGGALALAAALAAGPARGDEALGRRLAALRALEPHASAPAVRREVADSCPHHPWWAASDYGLRTRTRQAVRDASLRYGVDPALVRSVIRVESAGRHDAISHAGAQGLMQLMPATARQLGVVCVFDPRENVLAGTRYLRRLYDRLGSWPRALAGYHAGPTAVREGRIPAETRAYVARVLARWNPPN